MKAKNVQFWLGLPALALLLTLAAASAQAAPGFDRHTAWSADVSQPGAAPALGAPARAPASVALGYLHSACNANTVNESATLFWDFDTGADPYRDYAWWQYNGAVLDNADTTFAYEAPAVFLPSVADYVCQLASGCSQVMTRRGGQYRWLPVQPDLLGAEPRQLRQRRALGHGSRQSESLLAVHDLARCAQFQCLDARPAAVSRSSVRGYRAD